MNNFDKDGYILIKNFIDSDFIRIVSHYLENKIHRKEWEEDFDKLMVTNYGYYSDPLIESIMSESQSEIESAVNLKLYPTYSYTRVYQPGEHLKAHTDRGACEISVTVNVASKGDNSSFWIQYKNNDPIRLDLSPGDAVIYKGAEAIHWRNEIAKNSLLVQFMMHYVDVDGENSEFKYDKRERLGTPRRV